MNEEFFSLNLFASPDDSEDDDGSEAAVQNLPLPSQKQHQQQQSIPSHPIIKDLSDAILYLSQPIDGYNLQHIEYVISMYMGSMAQCRIHGKEINRLGGIDHLMTILYTLIGYWKLNVQSRKLSLDSLKRSEQEQDTYELELQVANVTLEALRDLSCGNALNRIQIGQYDYQIHSEETCKYDVPVVVVTSPDKSANARIYNGIGITSFFITRHAHQTWVEIPKAELKSMTNALGVARNITHSTPYNCKALHETGMTSVFIDRLLGKVQTVDQNGNATFTFHRLDLEEIVSCRCLPDSSKAWREACYRLAGTLINMAEKCRDAAIECAGFEEIIWILIDSWGGVKDWNALFDTGDLKKAIPVLHLGLFAVLTEKLRMEGEEGDCRDQVMHDARLRARSKNGHVDEIHSKRMLLDIIHGILENEKRRKLKAQERETSRKANR